LALPATIIIACSAYNGEEDKLRATAAGMTDFVTKPIMKKDLDTIISKYYEVQMQVPLSVLPPIWEILHVCIYIKLEVKNGISNSHGSFVGFIGFDRKRERIGARYKILNIIWLI